MSTPIAPIWMTRDGGDVAEIPGGRLFLYPNLGSVQISYQSNPPESMTAEQIAHARTRSRPANRRYWELGAVAPGTGMPGSFADLAIAKTVIDRAAARTDHTIGSRLLGEHGFRVTGTDPYGGVTWVRSQAERREIVVTNDHRVYARIEEYGLKTPQILMDIPLDNRVVARGVLEKPVSVHYVWPTFMANTDVLTAMALDVLALTASSN